MYFLEDTMNGGERLISSVSEDAATASTLGNPSNNYHNIIDTSMEAGERLPLLRPPTHLATVTSKKRQSSSELASQRIIIAAKQSRHRRAISEFRKKGRDYSAWTGRIGVHVKVDEIDIPKLSETLLIGLPGWDMSDMYDVIRLWQVETPYINHSMYDFPLSDDEGGAAGEYDYSAAMPEIYIFSFGAIVLWNFPSVDQEEKFMKSYILSQSDVIFSIFSRIH
jgi:uncharacterized Rmd1/YagE family protein